MHIGLLLFFLAQSRLFGLGDAMKRLGFSTKKMLQGFFRIVKKKTK